MSLLCLASGGLLATLPLTAFTLTWMHSIEKVRWEEDWRIGGTALVIGEARIRGSGAGMEPPPGARLWNGSWHYTPSIPPQERLRLTHSPYATGHELCTSGGCQLLADLLPGIDDNPGGTAVIELSVCPER